MRARIAYPLAELAVHMMMGAMLTYLGTGEWPQQMMDYFFAPSGTTTNGIPDRLSIPGYLNDVIEYYNAPVGTLLNKQAPLLAAVGELYRNEDYYSGTIYDPERDERWKAYTEWLANQAMPFSYRGWLRLRAHEANTRSQVMNFMGFQSAPKSIVAPEKMERYQQRQNKLGYKRREREQGRIHLFSP